MSKGNWFNTEHGAFDLRTKTLTNESTYTVRIGRVTDNFVVDRVVKIVTTADGNNLTLTIPDGLYPGQRLLIVWDTLGDDETVTISNTGDTFTFTDAHAYASIEWIDGTSGWVGLDVSAT